jgi:hypothetical protein
VASLAAFVLAIAMLGAAIGFTPLRSLDYWWHLRTGELIAESMSVPKADPYSYTVPGARWIDLHWTFQLSLHGLHQLGGHQAVRLAKGGCVLLLIAVLGSIGWQRRRAAITALALGGMLVASSGRLMLERPELLSFLLLAALLCLLDRHRRVGDRWIFAIVPLQLVWANLHGLFAVGIAVCAIALVAEWLRPLASGELRRMERVRDLAVVTAASAIVALANPNGVDGVLLPIQQLRMIGPLEARSSLGRTIVELQPAYSSLAGLLKLVWAGWLAAIAMALNRRRVPLFDALVFVAFFVLALVARRNVALFAIASAPIAVRNLGDVLDRHPLSARISMALGVAVLAFLSVAIAIQLRAPESTMTVHPLVRNRYPVAAVDWIARERPEGPIYHAMGDGGYLIWRLFPHYRVMVDGRLEVYGTERYRQLAQLGGGRPPGFKRLDEVYRFGVALLNHRFFPGMYLVRWLNRSPEWRLVWLDELSAVFVRVPPDEAAPWPELGVEGDYFSARLVDDSDPKWDLWRRTSRIALFHALDRSDLAAALRRDTCQRHAERAPLTCLH